MSDLSRRISALSPEQRAIFQQRLKQKGLSLHKVQAIPPRGEAGDAPLSFAQERLWFLHQLAPDSPVYNGPSAVRLSGPLRVDALRRSLDETTRRHETLRTTFVVVDGRPLQRIAAAQSMPLPAVDLRALPARLSDTTAQRLIAEEVRRPFDLAAGPLARALLLRLGATEHILLFTMHHIISDGWSTELLVQEVAALYEAFATGKPSPLAELPIQYADFAVWQREWLQGAVLEAQLDYWRERLAGAPQLLELPTDRPRPAVQRFEGALLTFTLPDALHGPLTALSQQEGATLFMTLLAAFQVLLARYSGQTDILVGSPVANRGRAELADLIGFFANNLVFRADLSGDPSFRALLRRVRDVATSAYAHPDLPFELLVKELNPDRTLSYAPIFQVAFNLQRILVPALERAGVMLRPLAVDNGTAKLDLNLFVWETDGRLSGSVEYNTDLFDAPTMMRLAGHLRTLLVGIAADADRRIAGLPLLSAAERRQLLGEWNDTAVEFRRQEAGGRITHRVADLLTSDSWLLTPDSWCLHQFFEQQAERTPDAVAVVFDGVTNDNPTNDERRTTNDEGADSSIVQLTYSELDRRANQLAHYLRARGVGPEAVVGVSMLRSAELVIALLAVLKAGGAYLPLDPDYPADRISFMLEDSGSTIVLVASNESSDKVTRRQGDKEADASFNVTLSPSHLVTGSDRRVVDLQSDWPAIAQMPASAPTQATSSANLAYVIYTSGSTGRPKGTMNSHRGIVNRLLWMQERYQLAADDRVLHKTSFSFDVSVWEFFWPLLAGARLILARPGGHKDSAYLAGLVAQHCITTLHFVPSMLQVFLDERGLERCASLRRVICSGEALGFDLQEHFFARLSAELHNLYGPTEAAVDVSAWTCVPASEQHGVPIGRPIANTQLYVLDRSFSPAPLGVTGELYIGGVQLARGYLKRPDLTAAAFLPNPFTTNDERRTTNAGTDPSSFRVPSGRRNSSRLYRTGDLVRQRPDGAIVFLGRLDQQVKLRGFRIELDEIAAALRSHEAVREAVVLARADHAEDKRLVAYVVPTNEGRTTNDEATDSLFVVSHSSLINELRDFLKQRLPDYMVPSAFVFLDALPLTTNGKLDRKALPAPDSARIELAEAFEAPRGPFEELLADMWRQLLGVEHIGRQESFFALGGHSLLATRLIARIRDVTQVELTVRSIFEAPTIAGMAAQMIATETQPGRIDKIAPALQRFQSLPAADSQRLQQQKQEREDTEIDARTLSETSGLSAEDLEVLSYLLEEDGVEIATEQTISPRTQQQHLPLSFPQQRLWFLDQLEHGNVAYNIPSAVRLNGTLDIGVLKRSLKAIIQRHEALRTTFASIAGEPVQMIAPTATLALPLFDLRGLPDGVRDPFSRELITGAAARPFDLARGPLIRAVLLRLAERAHILLMTIHHSVSDGWSLGVLVRELAALYAAGVTGEPATLPALPIQYADYAIWQRQSLQGPRLEIPLAYWRAQLANVSPLALPTDHPRPLTPRFRGALRWFSLPLDLSEALAALSRREGVTLFMTLLATFQTLLARYTGQTDITVGSPISGRTQIKTEPLIGFFVNTLVLRTNLSGDPTMRELLRQVRDITLDAYTHQDLPFEVLVEDLQPARGTSRTPLFQVMMILQNAPMPLVELSGLTLQLVQAESSAAKFDLSELTGLALQMVEAETGAAKFDLTLSMQESDHGLIGMLEYSTDLFEPATITRILAHFQRMLAGVAADPSRRLSELPLLSEAERQQLLVEWNTAPPVSQPYDGIPQAFAAQVARAPDAVALVADEGRKTNDEGLPTADCRLHLTYGELDMRANQLAHHLRSHGAGPGVVVALAVPRSIEAITAMLGVLKAGGAYLPLDLAGPAERLTFMLEDSQARVIVTNDERRTTNDESSDSSFVLRPSSSVNLQVVDLRADAAAIARRPTQRPAVSFDLAQPAYLIYTSGSTGRPKGVLGLARGLLNRVAWMAATHPFAASERCAQKTSLSFVDAIWEIYGPLLGGVPLALIPDALAQDPPQLVAELARQRVSRLVLVPALLRALLALGPRLARQLPDLRLWVSSGEELGAELAQLFHAELPGRTLLNLYGSSEVAADVLWAPVPAALTSAPLGRPIASTQVYVLDQHRQPVPIGITGELYVGGAGLARGYHHRPDLTAERFVPNPFARVSGVGYRVSEDATPNTRYPIPDTRLYKTGDLGRYRADGQIEYLGRGDAQVKLRGYRIEPGEIAAVLRSHLAVREAVVVPRADATGDTRLIAYVVPTEGTGDREQGTGVPHSITGDEGRRTKDEQRSPEDRKLKIEDSNADAGKALSSILYSLSSELRSFLKARLPDYMIPAAFVALDALPLTPSGKLDRLALPSPDYQASLENRFVAPRTQTEATLAAIWGDLLGVERIGVHDDFFDLGGHSLLATRVLAHIQDTFDVQLPLAVVFTNFTIAELAKQIAQRQITAAPEEDVAMLLEHLGTLSDEEVERLLSSTS